MRGQLRVVGNSEANHMIETPPTRRSDLSCRNTSDKSACGKFMKRILPADRGAFGMGKWSALPETRLLPPNSTPLPRLSADRLLASAARLNDYSVVPRRNEIFTFSYIRKRRLQVVIPR